MTTASEVVALQADMLDLFYVRHPDHPRVNVTMNTGGGVPLTIPRSQIGDMIDLEAIGDGDERDALLRDVTLAPVVAAGLTTGRTYRVQENMSVPIAERADNMAARLRIFDDIRPPSASGFVWLDEPIPAYVDASADIDGAGFSAITWGCLIDDGDDPRELMYVVTLWADLYHPSWWDHPPKRFTLTTRFCPIAVLVTRAGKRVGGPHVDTVRYQTYVTKYPNAQPRKPLRLVAALWQMLTETIPSDGDRVEQAGEDIDRRAQRRARRSGIDGPAVTTVVLRRQSRPTRHPGSGTPWDSRIKIAAYEAWRWIGSGDNRRRVRRTIPEHWSVGNVDLPVRERKVVRELRR